MGCYWEISGEIVARKESIKKVEDVLDFYGVQIDKEEGEKISFSSYEDGPYDTPDMLDLDLRPLVESGNFFAKSDKGGGIQRYRYGTKEPFYEESVGLEYYPSEVDDDEFVKRLPKDPVDAVLKAYATPENNTVKKEDKKKYCVGYKVEGRFYAYVEARSVSEAKELAQNEFYNADFGDLEDIGDCGTEQINVSDEEGNILWEK